MRISSGKLEVALRRAVLALVLVLLPSVAAGQERGILSKTITFGSDDAALALELSGGASISVVFSDGTVRIDGAEVGRYDAGDPLEAAWRSLLGVAVVLDGAPLGSALTGWVPPTRLSEEATEVARRIDVALETAFRADAPAPAVAEADAPQAAADPTSVRSQAAAPAVPETPDTPAPYTRVVIGETLEDGISGRTLGALLTRLDLLSDLSVDIDDLEVDGLRVLIGEDVRIDERTELDAPLVVVDAEVEVAGLLSGDLVVIGGEVDLLPTGTISGRVHLADSEFEDLGGELLGGSVRNVEVGAIDRSRIEEAVDAAVDAALDADLDADFDGAFDVQVDARRDAGGFLAGPRSFIRNVSRAISGIVSKLLTILILGILGGGFLYFAEPNLDAVAESTRRAPGRSLTVGLAGAFLALPAWILGIVGLAISIVGIPGLILWVPFFPVAVGLAMAMGYVAAARNVGVWLSRQRLRGFGWVRITNSYTLLFGGLTVLMSPWIAAHFLQIGGGWFSGIRAFLEVTGHFVNALATVIGFGAVLTTRAGRKPEYWADDLFTSPLDPEPRPRRSARAGFNEAGFESRTEPSGRGHGPAEGSSEAGSGASEAGDAPADGAEAGDDPPHVAEDATEAGDGPTDGETDTTAEGHSDGSSEGAGGEQKRDA